MPVLSQTDRIVDNVSSSSAFAARYRSRSLFNAAFGTASRRVWTNSDIALLVQPASRPEASNRARSKLLATWISIDGLTVACTAPAAPLPPVASVRQEI